MSSDDTRESDIYNAHGDAELQALLDAARPTRRTPTPEPGKKPAAAPESLVPASIPVVQPSHAFKKRPAAATKKPAAAPVPSDVVPASSRAAPVPSDVEPAPSRAEPVPSDVEPAPSPAEPVQSDGWPHEPDAAPGCMQEPPKKRRRTKGSSSQASPAPQPKAQPAQTLPEAVLDLKYEARKAYSNAYHRAKMQWAGHPHAIVCEEAAKAGRAASKAVLEGQLG